MLKQSYFTLFWNIQSKRFVSLPNKNRPILYLFDKVADVLLCSFLKLASNVCDRSESNVLNK